MCCLISRFACLQTVRDPICQLARWCCLISDLFSRFVAPNNWLIRYTHPLSLRMQEDRSGIPGAARIRISQHSIGIWRRGGCFWRPHKCNKSFSRRITSEIKKSFSISIHLNFVAGQTLSRIILLKSTNFGFDAKFA